MKSDFTCGNLSITFCVNRLGSFCVILLTIKQTNKRRWKHNLMAEAISTVNWLHCQTAPELRHSCPSPRGRQPSASWYDMPSWTPAVLNTTQYSTAIKGHPVEHILHQNITKLPDKTFCQYIILWYNSERIFYLTNT